MLRQVRREITQLQIAAEEGHAEVVSIVTNERAAVNGAIATSSGGLTAFQAFLALVWKTYFLNAPYRIG